MPRSSSARAWMTGGSSSSSIVRMPNGIARMTIEMTPRWRKPLTRKRARPGIAYARSTSPWLSNSAILASSAPMIWRIAPSVSDGVSGSVPEIGTSSPLIRQSGWDGTFRWRSEPSSSTSVCRQRCRSKDTFLMIGYPRQVLKGCWTCRKRCLSWPVWREGWVMGTPNLAPPPAPLKNVGLSP